MNIQPSEKNLRTCSVCFALYVINGDSSRYWCEISPRDSNGVFIYKIDGKCEFCRK